MAIPQRELEPFVDSSKIPTRILDMYNVEAGIAAAIQGKPGRMIAEALGMHQMTYCTLRYQCPSFKSLMDRARSEGLESIKDLILTLVDDNATLSPQALRVKFDSIIWYLRVSDPEKYGERTFITEKPIDLQGALTEARTRIIINPQRPAIDPFE